MKITENTPALLEFIIISRVIVLYIHTEMYIHYQFSFTYRRKRKRINTSNLIRVIVGTFTNGFYCNFVSRVRLDWK